MRACGAIYDIPVREVSKQDEIRRVAVRLFRYRNLATISSYCLAQLVANVRALHRQCFKLRRLRVGHVCTLIGNNIIDLSSLRRLRDASPKGLVKTFVIGALVGPQLQHLDSDCISRLFIFFNVYKRLLRREVSR